MFVRSEREISGCYDLSGHSAIGGVDDLPMARCRCDGFNSGGSGSDRWRGMGFRKRTQETQQVE
jgi:hypothetical protein